MKRFLAVILAVVLTISMLPMKAEAEVANSENLRFDFGAAGVEAGYIGVSAEDAYTAEVGYGFASTKAVENVPASGTGALADAVRFKSGVPGHVFHVDLPVGVYKITVTTGDVQSTTINAEGLPQLFFLTGNNAVDTFTIPVTDGQLNVYAGSGVGTEFSISALEIERTSTGTTTKPTIWIGGDSTAANYYNVPADAKRGWGQYLSNYVDMDQYDIRNISASGITSQELKDYFFPTAEYYGKSGDIMILAVGLNDYSQQYTGDPDAVDATEYIANMTEMIQRAKAKGMTVYLVKQNGQLDDCTKYPVLTNKWFGKELDTIAASENVGIIDLFEPWLVFCMENTVRVAGKYYSDDSVHMNAMGADMLAKMVSEQLFPVAKPAPGEDPYKNFDTVSTVYYEAKASGGPVVNPHKGYVMTVYDDWAFESTNPYGIGGSMNNTAWEMSTICTGEPKWDELNPKEGVYDWSSIDSMLEACEKYGYTYGIRILPYSHLSGSHDNYGKDHVFVPDWVFANGAKMERATLVSDPSVALDIPVWDDPIFLQAAKKFADALAAKYDGDPRVEFIDISVFGNWGEWHTTTFEGNPMPPVEIQKDMIKYYSDAFDKTWLCVTSGAYGEVYDYALSLGIPKRVNGLIGSHNYEWNLRPNYKANLPVIGENFLPYKMMLEPEVYAQGIVKDYDKHYLRWTPERFRETIEISHLSIYAFDQDSHHSYEFYNEQKDLIEEMNNRLGYNYTVTSAKRNGNKLLVTIKNTGLAPAFFNIDLCAEITDGEGNKLGNFGNPVRIAKGTFADDTEQSFLFEYSGTWDADKEICLAMYDADNTLVAGKNPTIKFDNKNTLSNNRLLLVEQNACETHTDSDKDGYCDACKAIADGISVMGGHSVSLSDNIGMKFYMDLDASVLADADAYIQFSMQGKEPIQVKVNNVGSPVEKDGKYYIFTYEVAAKEMADTITAQVFCSDGKGGTKEGVAYEYSVKQYAETLIGKTTNEEELALAKAMLNYGGYAQTYFGHNTGSLANAGYTDSTLEVPKADLQRYVPEVTDNSDIFTYAGSTLLLEAEIKVRHYFKLKEEQSYSGEALKRYEAQAEDRLTGTYYYWESEGIPAARLGEAVDYTGVDGISITYSPLSYATTVVANKDEKLKENEPLQNLMKALYLYYQAVVEYNN